jgi:hypothetical protein
MQPSARTPKRSRLLCIGLLVLSPLTCVVPGLAQEIRILPVRVITGHPVTVNIAVVIRGPITLESFGLDITPVTASATLTPGPRFAEWDAFQLSRRPSSIRVGGYTVSPTTILGEERFFDVGFTISEPGCASFWIGDYVDDLTGLASAEVDMMWEFPEMRDQDQGVIGVFGDPQATECCLQVDQPRTLYVVATLMNDSAVGIEEAEFRIEVSPPAPGAQFVWQPSMLVETADGDPVQNSASNDSAGTHLYLSGCQTGPKVVLGTLEVSGLVGEHELRVRPSWTHLRGSVDCTHVVLCGSCELRCLPSVSPYRKDVPLHLSKLNSPDCDAAPCGYVGVAQSKWTDIKRLYH